MKANKKAITSLQAAFIIIIIVIVAVIAAFILGGSGTPPTVTNPVTAYVDGAEQAGNYTEPQTLDWGTITLGNTYTKNFTVASKSAQPLTLKLLTTEPQGNTLTWMHNNTLLLPYDTAQSSLVLTIALNGSTGLYSWRLLAVNGTIPTPSPEPTAIPTPTPTPTPEPNALQFTIQCDSGIKNITITRNSQTSFVILAEDLPKTYTYTLGDTLKFEAAIQPDFTFNGWEFADGSMPEMANPLILTKTTLHSTTGNFTLTATTTLG